MKFTDGLFYAVSREVAKDYPDIEYEEVLVDTLCMQLVQKPEWFDVLLAAQPLRRHPVRPLRRSRRRPRRRPRRQHRRHASRSSSRSTAARPKYTGQNKVNPMAMMFSGMLMLRHMGETDAADRLERALADVIREGKSVTYDMKPDRNDPTAVGTSQVADAVIEKLKKN